VRLREAGDRQVAIAAATALSAEGLSLARATGLRKEEGQALRLVGQCALAAGHYADAQAHLHASLALLAQMGSALEAACSQLALAMALVQGSTGTSIPGAALALLAEARQTMDRVAPPWTLPRPTRWLRRGPRIETFLMGHQRQGGPCAVTPE
jgi:hypothetical protein